MAKSQLYNHEDQCGLRQFRLDVMAPPVITALVKQKQKDEELQASLGYMRFYLKKKKKINKKLIL